MSGLIPSDFINELLTRVDIVDVINARVPLTKSGHEFKACCPFHEERTPSFFVNPSKQFYHCFGCGESGSAISFLMKYGNLEFRETIEELASSAGLEIPVERSRISQGGDFSRLLEVMSQAQSAYQNELYHGNGSDAVKTYLKERKITPEIAHKFGVGYAPDQWDFLLKRYGNSANSKLILQKAGLVVAKDSKEYDRFRNRLMFPITDRRGRVIAFGGRIIGTGEPKYLNSPETMLFKKSNELFGLHLALSAVRKMKKVVIVEGYTDVLALSQFGVDYAVATLGTATTPYHIRELFRAASELVFCFDGDAAGRTAAWRAMEATLPMLYDGKLASFVFLPQGQDPDSLIREEGVDGFEKRVADGEPIADFVFRILRGNADTARHDGRAKLVEDFKPIFDKLPEGTLQQLMIKDMANYTGVSEDFIWSRLRSRNRPAGHARGHPPSSGPLEGGLTTKALAVLVQNPQFGWSFTDRRQLGGLRGRNIQLLIEVLGILEAEPKFTTAALVEKFRGSPHFDTIRQLVSFEHHVLNDGLEQEFRGMISSLHIQVIQQQIEDLKAKSKQPGGITDDELRVLTQRMVEKRELEERLRKSGGVLESRVQFGEARRNSPTENTV